MIATSSGQRESQSRLGACGEAVVFVKAPEVRLASRAVAMATDGVSAVVWATLWTEKVRSRIAPAQGEGGSGPPQQRLGAARLAKSITVTVHPAKTTVIRESLEGTS